MQEKCFQESDGLYYMIYLAEYNKTNVPQITKVFKDAYIKKNST